MNEARNQTSIRAETVPSHGNGKTTSGEPANDLKVKAAIAYHVTSHDRVCGERDELQKQNDRQEQMLTVAKIEIEGLRAELAAAQSRIASYQQDRDDAVANLAIYQTLFIAFNSLLRTFGIEHAPLIKEPHADAT
jgi:hypothetical protein